MQLARGERLRPLRVTQTNTGKNCAVDGCDRKAEWKGMCTAHQSQRRRTGTTHEIRIGKAADRQCRLPYCDRQQLALGLCERHYRQQLIGGKAALHPIKDRRDCTRPWLSSATGTAKSLPVPLGSSRNPVYYPGLAPLPIGINFCESNLCMKRPVRDGMCLECLQEWQPESAAALGYDQLGTRPI